MAEEEYTSGQVFSTHATYTESRVLWPFLLDSYRGTGGYESGIYLDAHQREKFYDAGGRVVGISDKFKDRQRRAYYPNIVKSIVDIPVQYVYQSVIRREGKSQAWLDFVKDCNGRGVELNRMMKQLVAYARLFGCMFALIDKPTPAVKPETKGDEQRQGLKPRIIPVYPSDIVDWKMEDGKLIWVKLLEKFERQGGPFAERETGYRVRVYTEDHWWLWEVETEPDTVETPNASTKLEFPIPSTKKGADGKEPAAILVREGVNTLGRIPLVGIYSEEPEFGSLYGTTDVYQSCRINRRIYNLASEHDEIIRDQTFSIFVMPRDTQTPLEGEPIKVTGTSSGLIYDPTGGGQPAFLSPDGTCAATIQTNIENLRMEMYRAAHLQYAEGFQQVRSGVAKSWNFDQTNRFLATLAEWGETAERQIADLVIRYSGADPADGDYEIEYPGEFNIADILDEIETTDMIIAMRISKTFSVKAAKDLVTKKFPNLSEEEKAKIFAEIEESDMVNPPQSMTVGPSSPLAAGSSIRARVAKMRGAKQALATGGQGDMMAQDPTVKATEAYQTRQVASGQA